ncbi:hypothetical protein JCM15765_23360 [Paradesulfitobacterium aromaticivorans]
MNNRRMYHVELFNAKNNSAKQVEAYFRDTALPFFRERNFKLNLLFTQYGLGPRQFWFVTEIEKVGDIDGWDSRTMKDAKGQEIMSCLAGMVGEARASVLIDLEPDVEWCGRFERMFHVEWFNPLGNSSDVQQFMLNVVLPYWRKRGYFVKLFQTIHELSPTEYWLVTQMDGFASLDQWAQMGAGEPEGQEILQKLLSLITVPRASIIKELFGGATVLPVRFGRQ